MLLFLISAALAHLCSESGLNFGVSSFSHDVFFLLLMALPAIVSTPTKFDENKFSGMDVSIPFPVIVVDQNGNILRANPAALSFFGLPDDRLLRRNLFDFCGGNVPEKTQLREALEKVCKGLPAANSIAKLVRDDGHPLRTLVFMAPVQFAENRTKSVQLFLMDASGVMEPELNRSLSLLEAVLESTAEGILVVDTEGNIQRYNRRFIDLWEIPEGVLEAQRDDAALKFVLNQLAEPRKFLQQVNYLYHHPEEESLDILKFKDGRVFERFSRPQRLGNRIVGRVWSFRDITEQKRMLDKLRLSEQRFRSYFEQSLMGIAITGLNKEWIEVNDKLCEILLYSREELAQLSWEDLTHPEDQEKNNKFFEEALDGKKKIYGLEKRYVRGDGKIINANISVCPIQNDRGEVACFLTVVEDVTRRKTTERELSRLNRELEHRVEERTAALREVENRYQILAEAAPVAIFHSDFAGNCTYVNSGWVNMTGLSREESLGRGWQEAVHPGDRRRLIEEWQTTLRSGGGVFEAVCRFLRSDGRLIYGLARALPLKTGGADISGLVATVTDVTARKLAEEKIARLNKDLQQHAAELETVNKELEAFSYSVSHDLRAPLRSIDGFSQALLEDYGAALDGTAADYLNRVRAATQRMGQLIDDLLMLSRVTRREIHIQTVNLTAMAERIAGDLRKEEPRRKVNFIIKKGLSVSGDPQLLQIVLQNLLSNAWKYTAREKTARIEFGDRDLNRSRTYFVRDNGVGFDSRYANKLFKPFQRLHGLNEFEGTGIGLATVKRIIHRHGGRVWAEGEVGKGATFYFTLSQNSGERS